VEPQKWISDMPEDKAITSTFIFLGPQDLTEELLQEKNNKEARKEN
jgi:hypothetical protein